jgi:hypothetical protein
MDARIRHTAGANVQRRTDAGIDVQSIAFQLFLLALRAWICTAFMRLVRRFTVSSFRRRISSMARGSPLGAGFSSSVHQAGRSMPIK